jgi:uncharacterized protein (TIGR03790 family)
VSASTGTVNYSIRTPSWLTASSAFGSTDTSGISITLTISATAFRLPPGSYGPGVAFTNVTNGQGSTTRSARLIIQAPSPRPLPSAGHGPEGGYLVEPVNVLDGNSTTVATLSVPRAGIQANEIAVLINDNDPQSVEVANYYQLKRGIPSQNMIHLRFNGNPDNHGIDAVDFAALKAQVDAAVGPNIQAFVISWTTPYRLTARRFSGTVVAYSNYSITSAFAYGVDPNYLTSDSCGAMVADPYYNTNSTKPYTDYHVRPTMMLAGTSVANVKAMIDRSVQADGTFPLGDGWLLRTSDALRSVRYPDFQATALAWNRPGALVMNYTYSMDELNGYNNVLFYMLGLGNLNYINTNTFTPGAVADTLTSTSGEILGIGGQTSILRFLEAGATASYGTQTEPCNYTQKFPQASVLVKNYFLGNTVLEAYTKSVQWPTQGVFVGDPLARPYGTKATLSNGTLTVTTTSLVPGTNYTLYSAPSATGPFSQIATVSVPNNQFATITVPGMSAPFYKLEK